jgi:DNA-binding MltR family transcriptional regulator
MILKDVSLFKYVLDHGYYIVISGNGHAMTVVDYEIIDRKYYLIVKYNQGKIRMFYKDANALIAEGAFQIELEDAVKRGFTRYCFVLPFQITEKETAEMRKKSEDLRRKLDVVDFMRRKKVVPNIISNALTNIMRTTRKSRSKSTP